MNLYDVMMGAQGGQGVNTLANQFGLSPQQTQAALQTMIPAFSAGFQKAAQEPAGFAALMAQMADPAHGQTYANPTQARAAPGLGGDAIGQIFGPRVAAEVGQQAALASGVSAQVIQQMMPIVASMLLGGVANAMAAQGLGGLIGQLSNIFAANAGFAPSAPAPPPSPAIPANPLFGNWMNMVNGMTPGAGGAPAPALQSGLAALNGLMQAGAQLSQAQQQGMNEIVKAMSGPSKS